MVQLLTFAMLGDIIENTTNKIDLRFMFLATKGFQTSQWLFYLSLIVYVIKQRKDIDWNLWARDWNSM